MNNRAQVVLIIACVAGAVGFVGVRILQSSGIRRYTAGAGFTGQSRLAELTDSGVNVVVFLETDSRGLPLLRATFTPVDHGFHLYSKDLDAKQSGGFGRATQLELLPNPSVKAAGPVFADSVPKEERIAGFNAVVEFYPDGPVTLRLPIQFGDAASNITAQVAVSYMACKTDGVCLRPVEREKVEIQIRR